MINKGQFRDTENNLYGLTITSEIGGSVKIELEFGDTPFTSSLEGFVQTGTILKCDGEPYQS